jgi:hypothetical protein
MASYMEMTIRELTKAMETQFGGNVFFAQSVPVEETHTGRTVWGGVVYIFRLVDNGKARRAYAWSASIEGSDRRRFLVVLHKGAIKSPRDAVRAAIAAEHRGTPK